MSAAIQADGLGTSYNGRAVLQGITFQVMNGDEFELGLFLPLGGMLAVALLVNGYALFKKTKE